MTGGAARRGCFASWRSVPCHGFLPRASAQVLRRASDAPSSLSRPTAESLFAAGLLSPARRWRSSPAAWPTSTPACQPACCWALARCRVPRASSPSPLARSPPWMFWQEMTGDPPLPRCAAWWPSSPRRRAGEALRSRAILCLPLTTRARKGLWLAATRRAWPTVPVRGLPSFSVFSIGSFVCARARASCPQVPYGCLSLRARSRLTRPCAGTWWSAPQRVRAG